MSHALGVSRRSLRVPLLVWSVRAEREREREETHNIDPNQLKEQQEAEKVALNRSGMKKWSGESEQLRN